MATIQELARYWGGDYDWRKAEAKLNALPQFMTEIDGLDIHFIHVRSKHENALPLIVTHGWPGSVIEQLKIIDPLTNPTAYGASASDAFHLVIPSLPGYGFSGKPTDDRLGSGAHRARLGRADEAPWIHAICGARRRFGRGRSATRWPSRRPRNCSVFTPTFLGLFRPTSRRRSSPAIRRHPVFQPTKNVRTSSSTVLFAKRRAYAQMMGTRPQTLYGLADSPVGLAAWLFDHGDGYGQPAAAITSAVLGRTINGHPAGDLTRDDVLDDFTLYWLTNTAISAARFYWEIHFNLYNAANVSIPAAVSVFPGENLSSAAELGGAGVSQAHLLQRGRQRRALCGLGTAATLCRRSARGLQIAARVPAR